MSDDRQGFLGSSTNEKSVTQPLKEGFVRALRAEYCSKPWTPAVGNWYDSSPENLTDEIIENIFDPIEENVR
jgi:hypothetical protein